VDLKKSPSSRIGHPREKQSSDLSTTTITKNSQVMNDEMKQTKSILVIKF